MWFSRYESCQSSVSIGYCLEPAYQGRGIVTQSVTFLIEYAFLTLQHNNVRCGHAVGNKQSRAVIKRCGFTYEGTCRQAEFLYDYYVDDAFYSILNSEWRSALS